ncbi:lytic polysaccharide monooxygenase [Patellaria atrata CBS 101060]|uniref:Lytic polysaccharide monooxygenase n=1 Tax=Patellaria atrata CBS 101060 TaxID=1346257 RepID=A0A9P4SIF8_9PEZI|nr:lytic polysaccharide monooxygenase [Patellaria atrata CBS 101060]
MWVKSLLVALAVSAVQGHMQLYEPAALKGGNNPYNEGGPDPYIQYPYGCCDKPHPGMCRGHLDLLGTRQGTPTATWQAGTKQTWSIYGLGPFAGNHYGGSCQTGFSIDKGKTFHVATSYIGNCPRRKGGMNETAQKFEFTVPSDLPVGEAVFAWTWVNRQQEFFMNCAVVNITKGESTIAGPPSHPPQTGPTGSGELDLGGCDCHCSSAVLNPDTDSYDGRNCTCTCSPPVRQRDLIVAHQHHRHNIYERFHHVHPKHKRAVAFRDRPLMMMANINPGFSCKTVRESGIETEYPNPGPDVVIGDTEYGGYSYGLPIGDCDVPMPSPA